MPRFLNRTYYGNHNVKFKIERTILTCQKLTKRAIRYGWTDGPTLITEKLLCYLNIQRIDNLTLNSLKQIFKKQLRK